MIIGVASFQGACSEHIPHLRQRGWRERLVVTGEDLEGLDGLIFPGGESTVMRRFFTRPSFQTALSAWRKRGRPVWGICAGALLLAREVDGRENPRGLVDASLERNAYGRHRESGYREILYENGTPVHGLFIRAPRISSTGRDVCILARSGGDPVVVRQGSVWLTTWHPELAEQSPLYDMIFS